MSGVPAGLDERRVTAMLERERAAWIRERPRAVAAHRRARRSQLHGTPQQWVAGFPPPVPLLVERADGAYLHDTDGHRYADFGLAATAALWGHTHPAVTAALHEQVDRGLVTIWPNEDQIWVTEELGRRFGLPVWQFTVSATDANRAALILARLVTGRPRVLVFNRAYHGSVDHTFAVLRDGVVTPTPGMSATGVDVTRTTEVVEFNDLAAVRRALAAGDIAAVLTEPVMTNGGAIIRPEPGFHQGLRELTERAGTLLVVDETQTIPAGPGGCTAELGLRPDLITMGKCVAGGLPAGLYGMTEAVARLAATHTRDGDAGIGSTLAGGALAVRAMRAVLAEVMTAPTYARMFTLAERYERAVGAVIAEHRLPWHVARLGARVSYAFTAKPPRAAGELYPRVGAAARQAIWLYLANRLVVTNGMSGAALFSPLTSDADVTRCCALTAEAIAALVPA